MPWRLGLLVIIAAPAWACSCSGTWPSVKQAWEKAPFVFLGTVEVADPDEDSNQTIFQAQYVRIHVDEAFKGASQGQTIELHQGGTDCDAKFRTGQRAVFYLYAGNTRGSWSVPGCTRALGNPESGGDDLLFLRGLPRSATGTRLSGEVELYEDSPTEAFKRVGGIPKVKVKVTDSRGFTQEIVTNGAGAYEILGLRPGRYSVSIDIPKGLKVKFPVTTGSPRVQGDDAAVELAPNGAVSVGFVLQADTQLSGRMLDGNGAPMADVCIDLEPAGGRGENGARFFDCSEKDGAFQMRMMPPGKYVLVAADEVSVNGVKSKSTLYYPGVRDRKRATIVSIEAGKYIDHIDIRLPSNEKRYTIAGRLQFSDAAPVPNAIVTFMSPDHGYSETTSTRPDGSFALPVIAGMEGQLNGRLAVFDPILRSCPEFKVEPRSQGMFHFMHAIPISLSSDSDHENLKLELSSPSCNSWPPVRK